MRPMQVFQSATKFYRHHKRRLLGKNLGTPPSLQRLTITSLKEKLWVFRNGIPRWK
ncbi:hypothetical protein KPB2_5506 [Klebsiella pneumoniae Kb677]|nr:hypothetical protein KPB2_5506 [Klebsiella pneumoniae Kb677]